MSFTCRQHSPNYRGICVKCGSAVSLPQSPATVRSCRQCRGPMSPVAFMLGPVCGRCVRLNHARVTGRR
jgi:hypothetical protein